VELYWQYRRNIGINHEHIAKWSNLEKSCEREIMFHNQPINDSEMLPEANTCVRAIYILIILMSMYIYSTILYKLCYIFFSFSIM